MDSRGHGGFKHWPLDQDHQSVDTVSAPPRCRKFSVADVLYFVFCGQPNRQICLGLGRVQREAEISDLRLLEYTRSIVSSFGSRPRARRSACMNPLIFLHAWQAHTHAHGTPIHVGHPYTTSTRQGLKGRNLCTPQASTATQFCTQAFLHVCTILPGWVGRHASPAGRTNTQHSHVQAWSHALSRYDVFPWPFETFRQHDPESS